MAESRSARHLTLQDCLLPRPAVCQSGIFCQKIFKHLSVTLRSSFPSRPCRQLWQQKGRGDMPGEPQLQRVLTGRKNAKTAYQLGGKRWGQWEQHDPTLSSSLAGSPRELKLALHFHVTLAWTNKMVSSFSDGKAFISARVMKGSGVEHLRVAASRHQ